MPAVPASARRSAEGGCDPRTESESDREDLRPCGDRRARNRPRGAGPHLSGTAAAWRGMGLRRPPRVPSLNDYGLTSLDLDLADARGECKPIVEPDAGRVLGRARIIADDFLQYQLRHRHTGNRGRLEEKLADAVARLQHAGRRH